MSAKFAARAMSLTSFFGWTGMGLGGFFFFFYFDLYDDYVWSFTFAGVMGLLNVLILLQFRFRIKRVEKKEGTIYLNS